MLRSDNFNTIAVNLLTMKGGRSMNGRTQVLRYTAVNNCMQSYVPKRKVQQSRVSSAMRHLQLLCLKIFM